MFSKLKLTLDHYPVGQDKDHTTADEASSQPDKDLGLLPHRRGDEATKAKEKENSRGHHEEVDKRQERGV